MQALILALTLLAAAWNAVGGAAAAPGDPMPTNDGGNPLPPKR